MQAFLQYCLGNCIGSLSVCPALWVNAPNTTFNYLKLAYSWLGSCSSKIAYSKPQIAFPVEITFPHLLLYLNEFQNRHLYHLGKNPHFKRSNKTVSFLQWKTSHFPYAYQHLQDLWCQLDSSPSYPIKSSYFLSKIHWADPVLTLLTSR